MTKYCDSVKEVLADAGLPGLKSQEAMQEHLAECNECFAFLEALGEVDRELTALTANEPHDDLASSVLKQVAQQQIAPTKKSKNHFRQIIMFLLTPLKIVNLIGEFVCRPFPTERAKRAVATISLAAIAVSMFLLRSMTATFFDDTKIREVGAGYSYDSPSASAPDYDNRLGSESSPQKRAEAGLINKHFQNSQKPAAPSEHPRDADEEIGQRGNTFYFGEANQYKITKKGAGDGGLAQDKFDDQIAGNKKELEKSALGSSPKNLEDLYYRQERKFKESYDLQGPASGRVPAAVSEPELQEYDLELAKTTELAAALNRVTPENERSDELKHQDRIVVGPNLWGFVNETPKDTLSNPAEAAKSSEATVVQGRKSELSGSTLAAKSKDGEERSMILKSDFDKGQIAGYSIQDNLSRLLSERSATQNLSFKEATGYWQNTYVPGDPEFRLLQSKLNRWDRSCLKGAIQPSLKLEELAHRNIQPFDAPTSAAIAGYLHADRRAINGESRMLVQVGLKATERLTGRRPAMNVGIVLDMRGNLSKEAKDGMKELVLSFAKARDIGDNFMITVAGRKVPSIENENFKHGYLQVTLDEAYKAKEKAPAEAHGLISAARQALEKIAATDDTNSPLGSSELIIITSQPMAAYMDALTQMAHTATRDGVTVSTIGVGSAVAGDELETLSLAGQGNRMFFKSGDDALALINRELATVSRVVARALRLRIRLAPGVKLVDVLGSRRLDEFAAHRVREAEKSVDQKLQRNLGIEADRGEDEEGIQIVIPTFLAGDAHVILLDVVAPGPGPIADLTVRYKDLVTLKNGIVRTNLTAVRGEAKDGALERNVLKNFVSYRLSKALKDAASALSQSNVSRAKALLSEYVSLIEALEKGLSGLHQDKELTQDAAMLREYLKAISVSESTCTAERNKLAESLKLSGSLKILPKPVLHD